MIKLLRSIFSRTTVTVTNVNDLLPYTNPENYVIGFRKGVLNEFNRNRMLEGKPFEIHGGPNDFIVLPKYIPKKEQP